MLPYLTMYERRWAPSVLQHGAVLCTRTFGSPKKLGSCCMTSLILRHFTSHGARKFRQVVRSFSTLDLLLTAGKRWVAFHYSGFAWVRVHICCLAYPAYSKTLPPERCYFFIRMLGIFEVILDTSTFFSGRFAVCRSNMVGIISTSLLFFARKRRTLLSVFPLTT